MENLNYLMKKPIRFININLKKYHQFNYNNMTEQDDNSRYLRLYPIPWPVFSLKNHKKDSDGWYNPKPRKNRNLIHKQFKINSEK